MIIIIFLFNITGDHPPITPMRCANFNELGDSWKLYEYITRHFIASLAPDMVVLL